eukprot:Protomagalhaensia_wolfi_Nauph_80__1661@NODE_2028_length_1240_cov_7_248127_g1587_i0_p1_GENE_NODE_2028_length_1240_cov_7_248127_g1587_i0NODE_2028_length_1240_cov_7_248127_g1587_i0_p1_ORF_typecomplete_len258_score16_65TPR_16/PF13432_6/5_6e05ANAPC3/PF12895_7/0_00014TPR_9/PF13371_6/0_00057Macoilin/PF09726_9/3_3e02Macoilin/PF09726_9/0_00084HOOK/PF05622_12/0_0012HOOK/PF05622_12/71JIP_LZII/PF16471_5/0_0023JIP_LZII/PF16471_5/1_3e03DUF3450/PF11932_8/0_0038DUF3450/PF11932_8/8_7e02Spc29/PF17082_5/0_0044TPR_
MEQRLADLRMEHEKACGLWKEDEMRYQQELNGMAQQCADLRRTVDGQRDTIAALNRERDDLIEQRDRLELRRGALNRELSSLSTERSASPCHPRTRRRESTRSHRSTQASSVSSDRLGKREPGQGTSPQTTAEPATRNVMPDGSQLAVLYANRAASNFCVKNFTSALQDATKCVQLDPTYARGWYIKGLCHFTFNEKKAACEALEAEAKIYCKTIERIRQQQQELRPQWPPPVIENVRTAIQSVSIPLLRYFSSRMG